MRRESCHQKNFQGNLPRKLLLKSDERLWFTETGETNEGFDFSQGFAKFVKELRLEVGDLVVLAMVGHETYEVATYDTSCCKKKNQFHQEIQK